MVDDPQATLAPCPFCGSAASMADNDNKEWYANTWWIECDGCGARGPRQFNGDERDMGGKVVRKDDECRVAAVASWNVRAP